MLPHQVLGRVAGQRQTHGAVIPAGSRQISRCYKHSRRAGNFILKDAFSMRERGCICLGVKWICDGAAVHSSRRLLGFPPSWRLCWCIRSDGRGEQWMMMCWWDRSSSLYPVCTNVWEGVCECMCHPGSSWAVVTAELSV